MPYLKDGTLFAVTVIHVRIHSPFGPKPGTTRIRASYPQPAPRLLFFGEGPRKNTCQGVQVMVVSPYSIYERCLVTVTRGLETLARPQYDPQTPK